MMRSMKQQSQQKEAAWGGPVITVNWFNVSIDGKKDEKLRERRADRVIEFSLQALCSSPDVIRNGIAALYL